MIELLTNQAESDRLFERWIKAMTSAGTQTDGGWAIDGTGILFSNYGDGGPGEIKDSVMLGLDTSLGRGVVKIVRPNVAQQDRGKLTVIARDGAGRNLLLRQGWLKKNPISRELRQQFAQFTRLQPVLTTPGRRRSPRNWYLVCDLSSTSAAIVGQTAAFANACALGRAKAGGGTVKPPPSEDYRIGLDEKGRTKKVTIGGGTREVTEMQGYVWQALKDCLGERMTKRMSNGYAVDVLIESAKMLIEIKTGASAHDIYEAVGQLLLYPSLITLPEGLHRVLLLPDQPQLRPQMAAAVAAAGIDIYCYSIGTLGKEPKVAFSRKFLARCA